MKTSKTDVAVIGGARRGWPAALEASKLGAKALILERDFEPGASCSSAYTTDSGC